MKNVLSSLLSIFILLQLTVVIAQTSDYTSYFQHAGEMYFSVSVENPETIQKLTRIVSVDHLDGNKVFAYANKLEFERFLQLGLQWNILPKPGETGERPKMLGIDELREVNNWDAYPTYEAYLEIMNQFAIDFPDICQVFSIGQSTDGRELMMVKISDNVSVREAEPQFLYTGTMHGDELVGYILLLRLSDYLLNNYATNSEIADLVNNAEIWINPLANPDGTFAGGNNTVWGSTRYNANNVDLNRNYPDPEDGLHPDGNVWQSETLIFMQIANENNFVMSANTHSGAEVINYPWDTWSRFAADDDWWQFVSREYADTVHNYAASTYLDGFDNGITNGYAWYTISGGRQDYMNYFHNCREVTMELSNTKKLQTSLLESHWNWNYRSLLNYIRQATYGISGIITDVDSGEPIAAKVFIEGHDIDNSFVFADSANGFYQRMLEAGTYDLTFSAEGYEPVTVSGITVSRYNTIQQNVQLSPGELTADFSSNLTNVSAGGSMDFTDLSLGAPVSWFWQFEGAAPLESFDQNPTGIKYNSPGIYDVSLTIENSEGEQSSIVKENYISVSAEYLISNQDITVATGLFFDSGGQNSNYQDNEDFVMTIYPALNESKLRLEFLEFLLESQSSCSYDWLKIYDGTSISDPLLGTWCGNDSPGTLTSTHIQGALTFAFYSDQSVNLPGWKAALNCVSEQELSIVGGWSGISLYLNPVDPNVENLFSEILNDLVIIVGEEGVYCPAQNINTLVTWDNKHGYLAKMNSPGNLIVPGIIEANQTLDLKLGWNHFPVLSNTQLLVSQLSSDLGGKLILIKEIAGVKTYWPEMEIYTLMNLLPGKSYMLYLSGDVAYTFPAID